MSSYSIMEWYIEFNAVFMLSAGTILCGGLGVLLNFCFRSKCSEFRLCSRHGLFYMRRDVDAENQELAVELEGKS
jgi:hypothetical protein